MQAVHQGAEQLPGVAAGHAGVKCPLMLVRQYMGSIPGWSLLLPAGWVMPFWQALAYQGKASKSTEHGVCLASMCAP